jgi:endonuclease G
MLIHEFAFDLDAAEEAAKRWEQNEAHHERYEDALRRNALSELDTAPRRAKRARRLLAHMGEGVPVAVAEAFNEALTETAAVDGIPDDLGDALQERVIGKSADFLFVEFFEQGIHASRAVGRIVTDLGDGRRGFGTGFMVSPRLLLTNHHVLHSEAVAARSVVEFNYQRDRRLQELPRRAFSLAPERFFLNDKRLDFALVAVGVAGDEAALAEFGWCPLIREEGKIVEGEPINIVQHPRGELKQVVIRENRFIQVLDPYAHYESDTLPGSSGSPVFNTQWEVVALHHSAVPRRDRTGALLRVDGQPWRKGIDPVETLDWVANEGIRISRLVEFISQARVRAHEAALRDELLGAAPPASSGQTASSATAAPPPHPRTREASAMAEAAHAPAGSVTVTIPLHVTVSLGVPTHPGSGAGLAAPPTAGGPGPAPTASPEAVLEKVEPDPGDPTYRNRPGYDPAFLGFEAPFPRLTNAVRPSAFEVAGAPGDDRYLLKYHHYSVILNKARSLAFVAGVNYNPVAPVHHPRDKDGDRWYFDPRVSSTGEFQAGQGVYAKNPLDRGHLVRRADAAWGETAEEAKLANDDTFHFTNCSPQHEITNQGLTGKAPPDLKLWGSLEEHVAAQGKKSKRRLCVFNGPIFAASDREYRGIQLPREFWKVVVFEGGEGKPAAAAFVLTQSQLIAGLKEAFDPGEYRAVQVTLRDLSMRTGLNFGRFVEWDVLEAEDAAERFTEADVPAVVLETLADVVL